MTVARLSEMDARKRSAAEMLGRGVSRKDTCAAVGIAPRTLERWIASAPGFRELARRTQAELPEPQALDVLRALLGSRDERIRLQAATALLKAPPEPDEPVELQAPIITVIEPRS